MKNYVSTSILNIDLMKLPQVLNELENSNVDMLHFDVMDGVFVPNISFGASLLENISCKCNLVMDVHLMISDPIKYIEQFAKAGANIISFHLESESDVAETIDLIHSFGVKACVAIKPNTPVEEVMPYLDKLEMVLVMTVEPGFGGQAFMHSSLDKIAKLKQIITSKNLNTEIQVDGGINSETAKLVMEKGANNLVAGSYIINSANMIDAVKSLR